MCERGERDDGETVVEGLPKSTLHELSRRLSFVPAGHRFSGWQKPRTLARVTYFYIDPRGPGPTISRRSWIVCRWKPSFPSDLSALSRLLGPT